MKIARCQSSRFCYEKIFFCIHTLNVNRACGVKDCKEEKRESIEGTVQYKKEKYIRMKMHIIRLVVSFLFCTDQFVFCMDT